MNLQSLAGAALLSLGVFNAAIAQQKLQSPLEKQMAQLMASRLGATSIEA